MHKEIEPQHPKALKKRIIKPENYELFMNELSKKPFECFSDFTKELRMLEGDYKDLIKKYPLISECGFIDEEEAESSSEYKSLAEHMKDISKGMKDKYPDQYKKLTARIFDTNKKSAKFQSVKIKKSLIERIIKKSQPEWQYIQIETLVENVLKYYIEAKDGIEKRKIAIKNKR